MFYLAARVLLYASSHRQDDTYHGFCYTSRGALAGTRNSSTGPPWRFVLTTHRTMSELSYHRATCPLHTHTQTHGQLGVSYEPFLLAVDELVVEQTHTHTHTHRQTDTRTARSELRAVPSCSRQAGDRTGRNSAPVTSRSSWPSSGHPSRWAQNSLPGCRDPGITQTVVIRLSI